MNNLLPRNIKNRTNFIVSAGSYPIHIASFFGSGIHKRIAQQMPRHCWQYKHQRKTLKIVIGKMVCLSEVKTYWSHLYDQWFKLRLKWPFDITKGTIIVNYSSFYLLGDIDTSQLHQHLPIYFRRRPSNGYLKLK